MQAIQCTDQLGSQAVPPLLWSRSSSGSLIPLLPVAQATRVAATAGADLKIETYPGVPEPAMVAFMFAQGYRARLGMFYDAMVPGGRLLRGFEFIHLGAGAIWFNIANPPGPAGAAAGDGDEEGGSGSTSSSSGAGGIANCSSSSSASSNSETVSSTSTNGSSDAVSSSRSRSTPGNTRYTYIYHHHYNCMPFTTAWCA
jgi:hypothetical protein